MEKLHNTGNENNYACKSELSEVACKMAVLLIKTLPTISLRAKIRPLKQFVSNIMDNNETLYYKILAQLYKR